MEAEARATPTPKIVLVASTVGWLLGIILLLSGAAILIPAIAMKALRPSALLAPAIGLTYCWSGYLLRKQRPLGAQVALVASGLFVALVLLGGGMRLSAALVLHGLFFVLAGGALGALGRKSREEGGIDRI